MSSSFSRLLYRKEREYLVHGYIGEIYDLYIPNDIITFCKNLYDDVYYWRMDGNAYGKFMNCEFGKELYGPTFTIKNIEFQLYSFPNGEYNGEQGYIQLYLKVSKYPPQMKSLHIYFVLYCEQTGIQFRRAKIFNFNVITADRNEYVHAWAAHCAPLKECKSFERITFGAMVDIIHYEHYDNALYKDYITPIEINVKSDYMWSLNDTMINKLKTLDFEQFVCSDRFDNNCWGLCLMPNGQNKEEKGNLRLGLVLYKLAFGLRYIKVHYTLKCIETNTVWIDIKQYVINVKWTSWPKELFLTKQLNDYTRLTFTVSLEIIELMSVNYQIIDRKEWSKFGFQQMDIQQSQYTLHSTIPLVDNVLPLVQSV